MTTSLSKVWIEDALRDINEVTGQEIKLTQGAKDVIRNFASKFVLAVTKKINSSKEKQSGDNKEKIHRIIKSDVLNAVNEIDSSLVDIANSKLYGKKSMKRTNRKAARARAKKKARKFQNLSENELNELIAKQEAMLDKQN